MDVPFSNLGTLPKAALAPRIPLPGPLSIFIEFTNRCNFKCKFCPESLPDYRERAGGIDRLSFEGFRKICDDIRDLGGVSVIRFYNMGEPLLHPEAPAMIRYAIDLGIAKRTELTTNGSVLSPEKVDGIIASGLDYIRLSIYGATKESHHSLTGSPVTPEKIAQNILTLRRRRDAAGATKPFIYVKMVDPMDPEEVDRFRRLYNGIADEVEIEPPHNWTQAEGSDLLQIAYGKEVKRDAEIARMRDKQVCPSPFYILALHADGEASVCCVDWQKATSVGNVFRESIRDIWNGPRMKEFRKLHLERRRCEIPVCRSCDFIYTFPDNIDELDPQILEPVGQL
jgi:radical SAM protein with 4Fe4S-binding SPASM domain